MRYEMFSHKIIIEDKSVKTYGLRVYDAGGNVKTLFDVSSDREAVAALAARLNEGQVEPEHLDCVLEDFYFENA